MLYVMQYVHVLQYGQYTQSKYIWVLENIRLENANKIINDYRILSLLRVMIRESNSNDSNGLMNWVEIEAFNSVVMTVYTSFQF